MSQPKNITIFQYRIHWYINIRKKKTNSSIAITALDLSHVLTLMTLLFESMLSQMLKYAGNIMVKYVFSKSCCGKDFSKPLCES